MNVIEQIATACLVRFILCFTHRTVIDEVYGLVGRSGIVGGWCGGLGAGGYGIDRARGCHRAVILSGIGNSTERIIRTADNILCGSDFEGIAGLTVIEDHLGIHAVRTLRHTELIDRFAVVVLIEGQVIGCGGVTARPCFILAVRTAVEVGKDLAVVGKGAVSIREVNEVVVGHRFERVDHCLLIGCKARAECCCDRCARKVEGRSCMAIGTRHDNHLRVLGSTYIDLHAGCIGRCLVNELGVFYCSVIQNLKLRCVLGQAHHIGDRAVDGILGQLQRVSRTVQLHTRTVQPQALSGRCNILWR